MKRYMALLRGINISGKNKVVMAELKKEFESWKKQAKEKIAKLKHGELSENEVYDWILKNK